MAGAQTNQRYEYESRSGANDLIHIPCKIRHCKSSHELRNHGLGPSKQIAGSSGGLANQPYPTHSRDHAAFYDQTSRTVTAQPSRGGTLLASETGRSTTELSAPTHTPIATVAPSFAAKYATTGNEYGSQDGLCPTCLRPWLAPFESEHPVTVPAYFKLLHQASVPPSRAQSRPSTPPPPLGMESGSNTPVSDARSTKLQDGVGVDGYYARFFVEKKKLGHGARGTVYLCQHVLNGNKLGDYAVKKIPVGHSSEFLLRSLSEVQLLESLRHENIIHYQHAWIENCRPSPFSPSVPYLHVLMMAANGGSLADWLSSRSGDAFASSPRSSGNVSGREGTSSPARVPSKTELLKEALRQRRAKRAQMQNKTEAEATELNFASTTSTSPCLSQTDRPFLPQDLASHSGVGVHFLREEEVLKLFSDVTAGLGFLHQKNVLHLDLKPANVLLHWDDEAEALLPRAMLSDFGSSVLLKGNWSRKRSGNTGTLEYVAPEMLMPDPLTGTFPEMTYSADQWGLGLVLHLLIFLRLPYSQIDDISQLRTEMLSYAGYRVVTPHPSASLEVLNMLAQLLSREPSHRPSCAEILRRLASPTPDDTNRRRSNGNAKDLTSQLRRQEKSSLLPIVRRPPIWASAPSSSSSTSTASRQTIEPLLSTPSEDAGDEAAQSSPLSPYPPYAGQHLLKDSARLSILASEPTLWSPAGLRNALSKHFHASSKMRVIVGVGFGLLQVAALDWTCYSSGAPALWARYAAVLTAMLITASL